MELQRAQEKCLQLLLLLLPSLAVQVQAQHYHQHAHVHPHPHRHLHPHSHPFYYDAAPPRLRRFEYLPVPAAYVAGYAAPAAPAGHYQQQTPNFQLINYRPTYPSLAVDYQQPQPQQQLPVAPSAAPPPPQSVASQLPSIYPQQSVQYQQRAAPQAELDKYRYEGNYIPPVQQRVALAPQLPPLPQRRIEQESLYNVPPALFTSDVLHVVPSRAAAVHHQQQHLQQQQQHLQQQHLQQLQQQEASQTERPRRAADTLAAESSAQRRSERVPRKESKYFQ